MSNTVRLTIDAEVAPAIAAVRNLETVINRLGQNTAIQRLAGRVQAFSNSAGSASTRLDRLDQQLTKVGSNRAFQALADQTKAMSASLNKVADSLGASLKEARGLASALRTVASSAKDVRSENSRTASAVASATQATVRQQAATQRVAVAARAVRTEAEGTASAWRRAGEYLGRVVASGARGMSMGSASLRGGATSVAGSVQGIGISTRMSGIALGQQLSNIFSGTLSGNLLSPILEGLKNALSSAVGILTIGAELGTRIVSGVAGGIVKAGGLILGGAIQTALSTAAGIVMASGKGLFASGGAVLLGIGSALNSVVSSAATIVGEAVGQIGNVLTGLGEAFRGAFQAAVNIAGSILNSLVSVAQDVVERIASTLGMVGKAVLGTVGVIGGFAARDVFKAEDALTRSFILLDPKVTPAQKESLRKWAYAMNREFGNLDAGQPGLALERIVSTGFQRDPEAAKAIATGALKLGSATGETDTQQISRTMAKMMLLYRDEFTKQADAVGSDLGTVLADKLFAIKNFGDVDIPQVAARLGDLLGPARMLGMTFDDLASTLAQITLVLGVEQSFTGLGQMLNTFQTLSKEGRGVMEEAGIAYTELSPNQKKMLEQYAAELKALREGKKATADLTKERDNASRTLRRMVLTGAPKEAIKAQRLAILNLDERIAGSGTQAGEKAIIAKMEEITKYGGKMRPVLDIFRDLNRALEEGRINELKYAKVVDNIRALRAASGLETLEKVSPGEKAAVAAGVTTGAFGSVDRAMGERQQNVGEKFGRVVKEIKQPFISFWLEQRGSFLSILDDMIAGLQRFNGWVEKALSDKGFAAFAKNLGGKVGGLMSAMFGGVDLKMSPSAFWATMNSGLDKFWSVASKAADGIGTIAGLLGRAAADSDLLNKAWSGIVSAATTVGNVLEGLSKGDTGPLNEMFAGGGKVLDTIITKVQMFAASLSGPLVEAVEVVRTAIDDLLNSLMQAGMMFAGGMGGLLLGQIGNNMITGGPGAAQQAMMTQALIAAGLGGGGVAGAAPGAAAAPMTLAQINKMKPGRDRVAARRAYYEALNPPTPPVIDPATGSILTRPALPVPDQVAVRGRGTAARPSFTKNILPGLGTHFKSRMNAMLPLLPLILAGTSGYLAGELSPETSGNSFDALNGGMTGALLGDVGMGAGSGAMIGGSLLGPWGAAGGALIGSAWGLLDDSDRKAMEARRYRLGAMKNQMSANRGVLRQNPMANLDAEGNLFDYTEMIQGTADPTRREALQKYVSEINARQQQMNDPSLKDATRSAAADMASRLESLREAVIQATKVEERAKAEASRGERIDVIAGTIQMMADAMPANELAGVVRELHALVAAIKKGEVSTLSGLQLAEGLEGRARRAYRSPSAVAARSAAGGRAGPALGFLPAGKVSLPGMGGINAKMMNPALAALVQGYLDSGNPIPANLLDPAALANGFTSGGATIAKMHAASPAEIAKKAGIVPGSGNQFGADQKVTTDYLNPFASDRMKRDHLGRLFYDLGNGRRHHFMSMALNDPFTGGMGAGSFGWGTKSMGRGIGEANTSFGMFKPAEGKSGFMQFGGAGPSNLQRAAASNYGAFQSKLNEAATALNQTAESLKAKGDEAGAEAAKKAAENFKSAAEGIANNSKALGSELKAMSDKLVGVERQQTDTTKEGFAMLRAMLDEKTRQYEELKAEVAALAALQQKGGE